jgi:hypothetical protein
VVSTPQAFDDLTRARDRSRDGEPNPGAMPRFIATHSESAPFNEWALVAPLFHGLIRRDGVFESMAPWRTDPTVKMRSRLQ